MDFSDPKFSKVLQTVKMKGISTKPLVRGQERSEMYANKVSGLKLKLELRYKKLYVSPSIYKVNWRYLPVSKASTMFKT